ncbi:ABC transporter ATP-binding protein [Desulfuribacillus alkaliarsenatis]|uniref:ABC transporter ATP-binding protein n=1 Tax=Desulfuribacillus alkaliarsenatis TaxID=766136 RepID=A0A1E5G1S7_9FIRM|nr:ABC transporter ATP-binding protein [Desulfuribacillus alkaliarsenatis]
MNDNVVLQVNNVAKSFAKNKVIHDITFEVRQGEVYGFLGPNGAGKTTLVRMMLGLIDFQQGIIKIHGHDIKKDFKSAVREVGAIVETPYFYPYMSGYDNLRLAANVYDGVTKENIDEVLEMVQMKKRSKDKVRTYSLGMRQRLGIARALLHKPKLVILDEPTNGLDPQGMREIRELIRQLAIERDITFFISSHLLKEVEVTCDRVAILNEGKLLATGTVQELLKEANADNFEDYFIELTKKERELHV